MVVKNYTGDRVNFTAASELALRDHGIRTDLVFVADDAAVELGRGKTGRRGVAGAVFVHKACGAVAWVGGGTGGGRAGGEDRGKQDR
jgi:dihydroxyacetone kinase